jgi:hypothetical protein
MSILREVFFSIRGQQFILNINRRRFNNLDINFRQQSNGRNFTPSPQGKNVYAPAQAKIFYLINYGPCVVRNLKR